MVPHAQWHVAVGTAFFGICTAIDGTAALKEVHSIDGTYTKAGAFSGADRAMQSATRRAYWMWSPPTATYFKYLLSYEQYSFRHAVAMHHSKCTMHTIGGLAVCDIVRYYRPHGGAVLR